MENEEPGPESLRREETRSATSAENLGDIARLGGDILKRTLSQGMGIVKEVKDTLPKEAQKLIATGKDELLKGLSKEALKEVGQTLVGFAIDKAFSAVRQHRLEISIRIRKNEDESSQRDKNDRPESKKRH